MTRFCKLSLYVVGITCLLVVIVTIRTTTQKRIVSALVAQARYAVKRISDTKFQTNQIPPSVAIELSDIIRKSSSSKIMGKKSVCFGIINLLDSDMKPIVYLGVLEFPLFQFDGIEINFQSQLELQYDLAGALGFKLHGYNPSMQTK